MAGQFPTLESNFIGERFGPALARFLAEQLERAGAHPEEIFRQTGWFKNLANEWSYEVAPMASRLKPEHARNIGTSELLVKKPSTAPDRQPELLRYDPGNPYEVKHANTPSQNMTHDPGDPFMARWADQKELPNVGETFDNPDLYGYVPELRDTTALLTRPMPFTGSGGGPWDNFSGGYGSGPGPGGGLEHVISASGEHSAQIARQGVTPLENAFTHETQHNINALQGSPAGATPVDADPAVGLQTLSQADREAQDIFSLINRWKKGQWDAGSPDFSGDLTNQWREKNPTLWGLYERYNDLIRKAGDFSGRGMPQDAIGKQINYESSVGETEARNAEHRATKMLGGIPMTDSPQEAALRERLTGVSGQGQRAADVHPFKTMDYPPDLQHLRFTIDDPYDAKVRPAPYLYNWMYQ